MFKIEEMRKTELFARKRTEYNKEYDLYGNELNSEF